MSKFTRWIASRPYLFAGVIFLVLALVGVKMFGWWREELGLLLILYVIAIMGIRLDEISRKIGSGTANANPKPDEAGTILAKLDEISRSLRVLNHYLAKLTAASKAKTRPSSAESRKSPKNSDS